MYHFNGNSEFRSVCKKWSNWTSGLGVGQKNPTPTPSVLRNPTSYDSSSATLLWTTTFVSRLWVLGPLSTWCWILYQHDAESYINMMLNPLSTWCWILYQHDLKLKLPFHCSTKVRVKINLQSWHKRSNLTKLKLEGVDHSFFYKFKINW